MTPNRKLILTLLCALVVPACSDTGSMPVDRPECAVSTTALDFGQVLVGSSADGVFVLRNQGQTTIEGTLASDSAEFTVLGATTYTLQPGQSLDVAVRFTPAGQGITSGTVTSGGDCAGVVCTGEGAVATPGASCTVTPTSLGFGQVELGSFDERTFLIANDGPVSFSGRVSNLCADFAVTAGGGPFTLAPSESITVVVRYSPTALGPGACSVSTGVDCGSVAVSGEGVAPVSSVSFATDIQPIFNVSCALSGCHRTPSPKGGLSLMSGQSYGQLVNVTSQGYAPAVRVVPGDPGESVLYNKLTNTGRFGGGMPPGGGLGQTEIDLIRAWILQGAQDN